MHFTDFIQMLFDETQKFIDLLLGGVVSILRVDIAMDERWTVDNFLGGRMLFR